MGKIICYDFRAEQRQKEFEELQMRVFQRLMMEAQDITPEDIKQEKQDEQRFLELVKEQSDWAKFVTEIGGMEYVPNKFNKSTN